MSRLFVTAGTKVSIGPAKEFTGTDLVAADFTTGTPTWTRITGTTNIGGAGDTAELVTSTQIDPGTLQSRVRKGKGARNAGSMAIVADLNPTDPGQLALVAAEKESTSYMIKVEFTDAPTGGTPSIRYFLAFVMSAGEQWDEANSAMKFNATLEIDSNIVRVAAAEA